MGERDYRGYKIAKWIFWGIIELFVIMVFLTWALTMLNAASNISVIIGIVSIAALLAVLVGQGINLFSRPIEKMKSTADTEIHAPAQHRMVEEFIEDGKANCSK